MVCILTRHYVGDPVRTKEIGVACSTYGESRDACRVLLGKPEVKELP
jgi:hypothetical protein